AHRRRNDLVGISYRFAALDLVDILHAGDHLAPHGILLVEKARIGEADEELRIGGVGILRPRHGTGAANMRLRVELGLEVWIFRAAGAGAVRASGLRHETFDHPMENDTVVEFFADELLDVRDVAWCQIRPHLDDDGSLRGFERERITGFNLGHGGLLLWDLWPAIAEAGREVNLTTGFAV